MTHPPRLQAWFVGGCDLSLPARSTVPPKHVPGFLTTPLRITNSPFSFCVSFGSVHAIYPFRFFGPLGVSPTFTPPSPKTRVKITPNRPCIPPFVTPSHFLGMLMQSIIYFPSPHSIGIFEEEDCIVYPLFSAHNPVRTMLNFPIFRGLAAPLESPSPPFLPLSFSDLSHVPLVASFCCKTGKSSRQPPYFPLLQPLYDFFP